jgi:uncharacterized surface protein with fasciclin (FAS1) repeats
VGGASAGRGTARRTIPGRATARTSRFEGANVVRAAARTTGTSKSRAVARDAARRSRAHFPRDLPVALLTIPNHEGVMHKMIFRMLAVAVMAAFTAGAVQAGSYGKTKAAGAGKDIVQTAKAAGSFGTLLTALKATGLDKELAKKGPFTVFAPTDEAFGKLPAGALDGLLKEPEKLKQVLLLHVVSGKVTAADVSKLESASTLGGDALAIDTSKGVRVGNANVTKADVMASNGVIHVIDSVLLPSN